MEPANNLRSTSVAASRPSD